MNLREDPKKRIELVKYLKQHHGYKDVDVMLLIDISDFNEGYKDEHMYPSICCKHENTYPIDRFGNSHCHDCGKFISHENK